MKRKHFFLKKKKKSMLLEFSSELKDYFVAVCEVRK